MLQTFIHTATKYDLPSFIEKCFYTINPNVKYLSNWHIELIADRLLACEKGDIKRLIINIPPRYLKSLCVNVAWPCWLLGHSPERRVISASYSQPIATKHSIDSRLILNSKWYKKIFPETKITDDQNEKDKFITTKRGFRLATSVGGSLTGEGGNFLIIDDPQNPININSTQSRETTVNWYEQVFASRLDDKNNGVIVLIMQRLHEKDLSGHLLGKNSGVWEHLNIPAIFEKEISYHFFNSSKTKNLKINSVLHDNRENLESLQRTKKELGTHTFSSQYMQNPIPYDGGMVKVEWLSRYKNFDLDGKKIVQSWDCAIKSAKENDYSAVSIWTEFENNYYLLEVQRFKLEYPDLKRKLINFYEKYPTTCEVLIEDKASGQMLIQELRKETKIPVIAILPKQDKVTRFAAVTTLFECGKIKIPEYADWLNDFEVEILTFPNSNNDDQIDTVSQYLTRSKNRVILEPRIRRL